MIRKPQLPLDRGPVDFVEFSLPPDTTSLRIRLAGHFSTQSTVVVEGWTGLNYSLLNMTRHGDRNMVSTNAFTGQQSGIFEESIPIWLSGGVTGYRFIRVTASRLHEDDWIDVQFFAGSKNTAPADLRAMINGANTALAGSGGSQRDSLAQRYGQPSYVIHEEPDDPVELLSP